MSFHYQLVPTKIMQLCPHQDFCEKNRLPCRYLHKCRYGDTCRNKNYCTYFHQANQARPQVLEILPYVPLPRGTNTVYRIPRHHIYTPEEIYGRQTHY